MKMFLPGFGHNLDQFDKQNIQQHTADEWNNQEKIFFSYGTWNEHLPWEGWKCLYWWGYWTTPRYPISLPLMTDLSRERCLVPPTARNWHPSKVVVNWTQENGKVTWLLLGKWPLSFPGMAPGDRPPSAARHRLARGASLEVAGGHPQRARSPIRVSRSVRMGVVWAASSVARLQRYDRPVSWGLALASVQQRRDKRQCVPSKTSVRSTNPSTSGLVTSLFWLSWSPAMRGLIGENHLRTAGEENTCTSGPRAFPVCDGYLVSAPRGNIYSHHFPHSSGLGPPVPAG